MNFNERVASALTNSSNSLVLTTLPFVMNKDDDRRHSIPNNSIVYGKEEYVVVLHLSNDPSDKIDTSNLNNDLCRTCHVNKTNFCEKCENEMFATFANLIKDSKNE